MTKLTKAIFPVAGLGTRFLPATKANPKEMLPIVDKPLIQYAVEEAVAAGITELIFVTSSSKRAIEDHFDSNFELEAALQESGKKELLDIVRGILPEGVSCAYIRQKYPQGLGHAVLCAKQFVMNEPFAVLLADDLIDGHSQPCLKQMIEIFNEVQATVIAVEKIDPGQSQEYGIVDAVSIDERTTAIRGIVGGEIQLTDAIAKLLDIEKVYAHQFLGTRYDCGSKLGYLKATVAYALKHPELADAFKHSLGTLLG
jgi:UTP--glucose-1-phosphate uridylyltransferase